MQKWQHIVWQIYWKLLQNANGSITYLVSHRRMQFSRKCNKQCTKFPFAGTVEWLPQACHVAGTVTAGQHAASCHSNMMIIIIITRSSEMSNHRPHAAVHRNAASFKLVRAFYHILLPQKFHDYISNGQIVTTFTNKHTYTHPQTDRHYWKQYLHYAIAVQLVIIQFEGCITWQQTLQGCQMWWVFCNKCR